MDPIKQTGITPQEVNPKTPVEAKAETEEDKSVFGSGLVDAGAKVGELVKENGFGVLFALGGLPLAVSVLRGEEIKEEIQKDIDVLKEEIQEDIDALKENPSLGLGALLFGAGAITLASEASEFFEGAIDKAKDFFDGDKKIEEDKSVYGNAIFDASTKVVELVKENDFGTLFAQGGFSGILATEIQENIEAIKDFFDGDKKIEEDG